MDTAWISAITALGAVILSPLVSIYVVRRQTAASVLSANRQAWINTLRDTISEFVSHATILRSYHSAEVIDEEEFLEKFERIFFLESKVALLINPLEDDHKKLVKLLAEARMATFPNVGKNKKNGSTGKTSEKKPRDMAEVYRDITACSQQILKREWKRVKQLQ